MEENQSIVKEVESASYDAAEKTFDFIGADTQTALVCESNPEMKEKFISALTTMNYHVTASASGREALKNMRFNVYDLVVLNEGFDGTDENSNEVLKYLQNMAAATRRNIFVVLVTDKYRTMDNMMAFNKSVNILINKNNIDDFAAIIKQGVDDNRAFYSIFKESLKKLGRI